MLLSALSILPVFLRFLDLCVMPAAIQTWAALAILDRDLKYALNSF